MARSKPKFRPVSEKPKKGVSCPCIQDISETKLPHHHHHQQQFNPVVDMYQPNDEYIDLESFSEASSFGLQVDPLEITGIGDQFEEATTYLSGGNLSAGLDPDSEPLEEEEGSPSSERRKLNIAVTVMSWLDNYGQARGYRLDSNGTSLLIQTDEISRIDSGSIDVDETHSTKCQNEEFFVGPEALKHQLALLEKACSTLINFRNDLEPLNKMTKSPVNWRNIQNVLSTWANLMSTVWKRSREGNVTGSELYTFTRLSENLESLAVLVSPVDISGFANSVVKLSLEKIQGFVNLAFKWAKEIGAVGKTKEFNLGVTSWTDSMKIISMVVNEQLKLITLKCARNLLDSCTMSTLCPKYELILCDIIPSKTSAGWTFFGKVKLRTIIENNNNNSNKGPKQMKQINVNSMDSRLSIKFCASQSRMFPCIDYGALFHVVCRASWECRKYYENVSTQLVRTITYLQQQQHLIPESSPNKIYCKVSKLELRTVMMNQVLAFFAAIIAADQIDPTIAALDEILRSFHFLIMYMVKILKKFIKSIKKHQQQQTGGTPFKEIVVPLETVSNTLFQTIRRMLSLGPLNSSSSILETNNNNKDRTMNVNTIEGHDTSLLNIVNKMLEDAINNLYASSSTSVFNFQNGIQTIFAIGQLTSQPEFERQATLDTEMKNLIMCHLNGLEKANKEANTNFKMIVHLVDQKIKVAERHMDVLMKGVTALGIMAPSRTSGVSFSHRHGKFILIRHKRNSYIRHQAKQLRHATEIRRHTRKYVVEPAYEDGSDNNDE